MTIASSAQSALGCPGDWQPECSVTNLTFDEADGVWQGRFDLPAGSWEYKAALNGSWTENYGAMAQRDGPNIALSLEDAASVKFYYDHGTHWITDDRNSVIATLPGSFQSELGCPGDWSPDCLRSWLQDPDGDGVYTFTTTEIPAGDWEVKVAINESWDVNYGAGGARDGANIPFTVPSDGDLVAFSYDAESHVLTIGGDLPRGDLRTARAYWLDKDTLAWDVASAATVRLHYSADASLGVTPEGLTGGSAITLEPSGNVSGTLAERFPHLAGLPTFDIRSGDLSSVPDILRAQFALAATDDGGTLIDATGIQPAGVLDDLYAYDGALGVTYRGNVPTVRVWAPTAQSVRLHVFDGADAPLGSETIVPMTRDASSGTWSATGKRNWDRKYYLYEVVVYARSVGEIVTNLVTDPYSLNLSIDSERSQIIDLADADLKPAGWAALRKPSLAAPEDAAIYELHVRDFSRDDPSVPAGERRTFAAFGELGSNGMTHLRRLAAAGLTHVHLLPAFDCASIPEDPADRASPGDLSAYPPNGEQQQDAVWETRDQDAFNWCYDPYHYTAPEGSYATDANGTARVREFREMVAGLNQAGLRVVMDVVYNHTSGSLQGDRSVLDRIVPDYYHRLNATGGIEMSSCCANTASENAMMEKLMIDSLVTWAREYKVDGFRFDLMGHHSRQNILNAQDRLQALTQAKDGVDGSAIYLYGEGWNFGEVANDRLFVQATQENMGEGTGVGTFNDRIRDAVRGGGPFDTGIGHVRTQGFINGLFTDPNAENTGSEAERDELLRLTDRIRIGLAGSLEDFTFTDRFGNEVRGGDVENVGYTSDPQEIINYVAAHDNETLFDINQYKLPADATPADRVRVQNLGNDVVALAQGVPFFHAGQDILRSKSMDRNSYNSGDWFNVLDFTLSDNGWGRGLPPEADNADNWSVIRPYLGDAGRAPAPSDIDAAAAHMREVLRIRKSSPLFRLRTADAVKNALAFHNTGPGQIPGLIVESLSGEDSIEIVTLINAAPKARSFALPDVTGRPFILHPVQQASADPIVRTASFDSASATFDVPARTTAVFVLEAVSADLDADGDVDRDDVTLLMRSRGPVTPETRGGDLDGDGVITVLDARRMQELCTRPQCATR